jgi:hypothetical protein
LLSFLTGDPEISLWPSTEGPSREGRGKYHRWLWAESRAVPPLLPSRRGRSSSMAVRCLPIVRSSLLPSRRGRSSGAKSVRWEGRGRPSTRKGRVEKVGAKSVRWEGSGRPSTSNGRVEKVGAKSVRWGGSGRPSTRNGRVEKVGAKSVRWEGSMAVRFLPIVRSSLLPSRRGRSSSMAVRCLPIVRSSLLPSRRGRSSSMAVRCPASGR